MDGTSKNIVICVMHLEIIDVKNILNMNEFIEKERK